MPAHTNTHRTRTLLPLILTITLLLTAAAAITTTNTRNANAAEPLGDGLPFGDGLGPAAFAGSQILAVTPAETIATFELINGTWQQIDEFDPLQQLGIEPLDEVNIATISVDGSLAMITAYNHTNDGQSNDRQIILEKGTDGRWLATASLDPLALGQLSGNTVAGNVDGTVHVVTKTADGWVDQPITDGRFRDISGPWIAIEGPINDELWHNANGQWTLQQTLGASSVWMAIDGDLFIRATVDGDYDTWQLSGDSWTKLDTQRLTPGLVTAFNDGAMVIETVTDQRNGTGYGSLYERDQNGWTLVFEDQRLLNAGFNSNPIINSTLIIGRETRLQAATYLRTPGSISSTSTTSSSTTSTTSPSVTTTTNPSGPPPTGPIPCVGLNTLNAQGSFTPKTYWSTQPHYLNTTDTTARIVATHLNCTNGTLDPTTATANTKFQNLQFTANTFTPITKTNRQTTITGTGTITGDTTTYDYELTITDKTDNRGLTDNYKIRIFNPNQTTPTIVIKGPVRGHKITTT